jgi:hypothetical protein
MWEVSRGSPLILHIRDSLATICARPLTAVKQVHRHI